MTRGPAWAARAAVLALGVALGAGLLGGCGGSPAPLGPSGVDGLTIPTPHPHPADFVDRVDNRWFPLVPGTRWSYRYFTPGNLDTVFATVLPGTRAVAGVATTAVRFSIRRSSGGTTFAAVRWYAQDTAGNVWWFGQRVGRTLPLDPLATRSWRAGRRGAEAGLMMPAHPRVGDGFVNGSRPRTLERRSTVLSVDAAVALPKGHYHHAVETRDLSSLAPIRVVTTFFAPGVGLVAQDTSGTPSTELTLLRTSRPEVCRSLVEPAQRGPVLVCLTPRAQLASTR
jgi:hypothetical protein